MRSSKIHLAKALKTCDQELQDKEQESQDSFCLSNNDWEEDWKQRNLQIKSMP